MNFNTILFRYNYKFCENNNFQKDLCMNTNYNNTHYKFIFKKISYWEN